MSSDGEMAAFLTARLDEDEHYLRTMIEVGEQAAAAASPADLADVHAVAVTILSDPRARQLIEQRMDSPVPVPNDLKRLLREVAAKRKILAEHKAVTRLAGLTEQELGFLGWYREWVLKNLAAVWSDHPEFRQEWAVK